MRVNAQVLGGRLRIGHAVPFAILAGCLVLLWPGLKAQDFAALKAQWGAITAGQWVLCVVFTAISFWAVGKYDVIAHRHFRTGIGESIAHKSGLAAIALAQSLGLGLITGAAARWRLLPDHSMSQAIKITIFVTGLFLFAMIVLVSGLVAFFADLTALKSPAFAVFFVSLTVCTLLIFVPRITIAGHTLEMPGLPAIGGAFGWAGIDVLAASLAMYVLMPTDLAPGYWAFLPIFCLALAAGIISGTPGGVGPFEIVLFALTAGTSTASIAAEPLIVALAGFRLVYYAIPAVLAGVYFACGTQRDAVWTAPTRVARSCVDAPRAETAVIRQSGGNVCTIAKTPVAVWKTNHSHIGIFSPFQRVFSSFFTEFKETARRENRLAAFYKCDKHTAFQARRAGWQVVHMADDAVINLTQFALQTPARARLRRKIRKATKNGVQIRAMRPADIGTLAAIDSAWQSRCGRARGGTMGRFCPTYLAGQAVYVAEKDDRILAFASFHVGANEWALDLMRDSSISVDGTMYALVHHAIEFAKKSGVAQFSLSAVPACPDPGSAFWRFAAIKTAGLSHSAGLRQFKSAFAPRWMPLYTAAPSKLAFVLCALDIARAVFFPGPASAVQHPFANSAHVNDENYEVASKSAA